MILLDYIVNLSIFSLLVSVPLILRSFISHKPLKDLHLLGGIYAGIISVILVGLSFNEQGYSYDIRYAILILVFSYLGPGAGIITAIIALVTRLAISENWLPAIIGLLLILIAFTVIHKYCRQHKAVRKTAILYGVYCAIYIITVPIIFNVFRDSPIFHLQYILFVGLGVIVGSLLIESYERLIRIITEKKRMEKTLEESESKYRLIAENTSDLIAVMDRDRSLSYLSPSHELVLGYEVAELQNMEVDFVIHPDEAEYFQAGMQRIFENNERMAMEFRLKHRGGHWIEFESRCMPVEGENGVIEHVVMISRDISERKKQRNFFCSLRNYRLSGSLQPGLPMKSETRLQPSKGFCSFIRAAIAKLMHCCLANWSALKISPLKCFRLENRRPFKWTRLS